MSVNETTYLGFRHTTGDASRVPWVPAVLVPTGARDIHFASAADEGADWNVANPTHPRFYVHSETTPATNYVYLSHDGTNSILNGSTALLLQVAEATVLTVAATVFTFAQDVVISSGFGLNVGSATQVTVSDGDGATNLIPEVQALGVGTAFAGGAIVAATFNTTNTRAVSPKLILVKGGAATQVATTAVADNEVVGSIIAYGSDSADFETPVAAIEFVVDDVGAPGAGAIGGSLEFYTTADAGETLTLAFTINNDQNIYIANSNGLIVGHTAAVAIGGDIIEVQILGTESVDSSLTLQRYSANATPPFLMFGKGRAATIGTMTIVTTGDSLGEIRAYGVDGVDLNSNSNPSASIQFVSSGTIGADRVPAEIRFRTATNAAPSVITTALTIDNAQTTIVADGFIFYVGVKAVPGTALGANWIGLEDSTTDPTGTLTNSLAIYTPDAGDSLDFLHADGTTDSLGT